MNETLRLVPALVTGILLGVMFFGGLWWTVQKAMTSRQPARWLLGSKLLRTGITLAGFHVVSGGRWMSLLTCLVGFILARLLVMRRARLDDMPKGLAREASHASQP